MKILVATERTQGAVPGDYRYTVDGELVTTVTVPCNDEQCGCGRGFAGLASDRATTTALVIERPGFTPEALATAVLDSLDRQGWTYGLRPDEVDELVADHLDELELICHQYPVGTVLGRNGDIVYPRALLSQL